MGGRWILGKCQIRVCLYNIRKLYFLLGDVRHRPDSKNCEKKAVRDGTLPRGQRLVPTLNRKTKITKMPAPARIRAAALAVADWLMHSLYLGGSFYPETSVRYRGTLRTKTVSRFQIIL